MKAVILAGGLGSRLRPFTEAIPKPLLPIGEQSLLEIQITRLKHFGVEEVFLATNYKSEYVRSFMGDGSRYGIKLTVSHEEKPLGTAGPVRLLREHLTEPFFLMNGDILSTVDFAKMYEFATCLESDLCVGIKKMITPFAFGNVFHEGNFVTGIEEKPNIETDIIAGIYVMKPGIFDHIPENTYFGMDHLILSMLDKKVPVAKYSIWELWLDIGQLPDYEKAQEIYEQHFKNGPGA